MHVLRFVSPYLFPLKFDPFHFPVTGTEIFLLVTDSSTCFNVVFDRIHRSKIHIDKEQLRRTFESDVCSLNAEC